MYYDLDTHRAHYQSQALQVVCGCLQAGCLGGYAAYVHACDVVGMTAVIPESEADATSGSLSDMVRPLLDDADLAYLDYFTEAQPYTLRALTPGTLRNPAMVNLFTNALERLLTCHQILAAGGTGALGEVIRMARVFNDAPSRYGVPTGTYTAHVLASLHHVMLQAYMLYDDTGNLLDTILPDGTLLVGLMRYLERLDADETARKASKAWQATHAGKVPQWLPWQEYKRERAARRDIDRRLAVESGKYVITAPSHGRFMRRDKPRHR